MEFMAADISISRTWPHFEEEEMILFRKKRILLIEEDWDLSQLLSNLLAKHLDIEVDVVKNPYQALGKMIHEPFDVIVLDTKLNPFQAILEAERFLDPVLETHFASTGKVPVVALVNEDSDPVTGLESQYFRITAEVLRNPRLNVTLRAVEEELGEILDL